MHGWRVFGDNEALYILIYIYISLNKSLIKGSQGFAKARSPRSVTLNPILALLAL